MADESGPAGDREGNEEPRDSDEQQVTDDEQPRDDEQQSVTDDESEQEPSDDPEQSDEGDEQPSSDDPEQSGEDPEQPSSDDLEEASTADDEPEPPADDESEPPADDESEPPVETDGEGVVGGGHDTDEETYPDPDDDIGGISTPPDDEEMPLADHIEEMVLRLAVVVLVGSAGTAFGLLFASDAIGFIWTDIFPYQAEEVPPPHIYHPLELWLTRIKASALLGIMVALPMFVYQCYLFMKPGLYPNERKYYLAAVPTSVVLAGVGMLFSYALVLPILFYYFTFYAEGSAQIAYALGDTFDLVITLTGFLAIVFQIPPFIMLAIMMGVTTRRWLAQKRLYFWAAFFGLAFMFTFDPTAMAPVLVALTMIFLFEGTLLILKWVGKE